MLAGHYEGAKQPSNEARAYSTLLAFAPDDQGGLYGYAHVMMQRGPDGAAEATQALDRMLALDADDPSALEAKAELLVRSGRTDDARPLFARAASVSPMAGASHVALAVLAARDKRDADSIAELEAARRIEPGDAWILGHLHDAYARSGDAARIAEIEHAQAFFSSRQGQAPTSATEWLPDGWR
jgi:predicted Zn-dependent protease